MNREPAIAGIATSQKYAVPAHRDTGINAAFGELHPGTWPSQSVKGEAAVPKFRPDHEDPQDDNGDDEREDLPAAHQCHVPAGLLTASDPVGLEVATDHPGRPAITDQPKPQTAVGHPQGRRVALGDLAIDRRIAV
jgi:hypothetical protein